MSTRPWYMVFDDRNHQKDHRHVGTQCYRALADRCKKNALQRTARLRRKEHLREQLSVAPRFPVLHRRIMRLRSTRARWRSCYAAIAAFKFSSTLSRKPVVESHFWSAPTSSARSLVM